VFGKGVVKNVDTILMEEEKAERKYRLPASNELKEMNYEMLTLEMAKAEEMMAKPKFIKILKEIKSGFNISNVYNMMDKRIVYLEQPISTIASS
jgi:hypothetical protein